MVENLPLRPVERPDATDQVDPKNSSVREGTENFYSGSEPFFQFFTQIQVVLSTLRLTLEHRVVVPTADLTSQIENARRSFQHSGNLIVIVQDVGRISGQFAQRVQSWEREVQNIDRDKRAMNGTRIQQIKAEVAHVRSRIHAIDRGLIKLEVKLHQMAGEAQKERQTKAQLKNGDQSPDGLPANTSPVHDGGSACES